jgi:hypothetical protein
MTNYDLTAVINLHREGYLSKASLDSAARAAKHAGSYGFTVETVLVLDRPDETTVALAEAHRAPGGKICRVDFGDLGLSRNHGVERSSGRLVAFLDGDDLWGESWLTECILASHSARGRVVWHPEVSIYFGTSIRVFRHIDMESDEFDLLDLAFSNLWTSLACAERSIFVEAPYSSTDLEAKIGYEDWSWNLHTIELGFLHKVVSGTGHAIRIKCANHSLLQHTNQAGAAPRPTTAFRSLLKPSPRKPSVVIPPRSQFSRNEPASAPRDAAAAAEPFGAPRRKAEAA